MQDGQEGVADNLDMCQPLRNSAVMCSSYAQTGAAQARRTMTCRL